MEILYFPTALSALPSVVRQDLCHHETLDIALFGGTFDPIHNAHVAVARAARDRFDFHRVLIVPAAVPPHKLHRLTESWERRYRMVELSCAHEDRLQASDLEAGTERSYTIDTLAKAQQVYGSRSRLWFIIGADAFAEITTWHRWQDVIRIAEFVVVTRPGHDYTIPEGCRVHPLDSVYSPVSSSRIRNLLAQCKQPEELAPAVFEYIKEHRLYGYGSACMPEAASEGFP